LHASAICGNFQSVFNLLQTDFGALFGEGRVLAQSVNEKFFFAID
jgi:hypothetical protein